MNQVHKFLFFYTDVVWCVKVPLPMFCFFYKTTAAPEVGGASGGGEKKGTGIGVESRSDRLLSRLFVLLGVREFFYDGIEVFVLSSFVERSCIKSRCSKGTCLIPE